MINFTLDHKIALVSGSSQGLGLVMARGMAEAGATVILNGRNLDKLQKVVHSLNQDGFSVQGKAFDVTDTESALQAVNEIQSDIGPIDILVNNAGIQSRHPLEDFPEVDWEQILNVHLKGAFILSKAVVKSMMQRKQGKIINICSMQSELARPTIAAYAAAKGGLKMLTKSMATEWGKYNIQVNGIGPGYYKSDMTKALWQNPEFDSWLCARTPANRWGNPEELIGPAVFLASDASSYVNGHILYVDGGMLACV